MKPKKVLVIFAFFILHFIFFIQLSAADTWVKTYQPFGDEVDYFVEDIRVCPDEGYAVIGSIWNSEFSTNNGFLMKTDIDGNLLWASIDTVSFVSGPEPAGFVVLDDGSFITAGNNFWFGGRYFLKRSPDGIIEWTVELDNNHGVEAIELTNEGNLITTAGSMDGSINLQKFDLEGNLIWRRNYLPNGFDYGSGLSVTQTLDGGYALTGVVNGPNNWDILVIKTDENGDSLWTWTYNGTANYSDKGNCIIENSENELLVGAYISNCDYRDYFGYLIKMNTIGDTIWAQKITGTTSILSLIQIQDSEYLLRCNNNITKIQDNHEIIWQVPSLVDLNASGDRTIWELPDRSILYLGKQYWSEYISLVKCDSTGQLPIDENHMQLLSNLRCYPNPLNREAKIYYNLPNSANVGIKIYNVKGQLVEPLLHGQKLAGEHTLIWNAQGYPSGVYFIKLVINNRIEKVKKILVIQ
ncbi:MAG: T9SS type A sorting domain-containing protein [Bacteroidetes bacterium]|nr:T9SS type A sorting domain-containing protein [Bacteroidota bacterium]